MIAYGALSLAPDLDVLAFRFGIPYEHAFGHRGATHSILAALLGACLIALVARCANHPFGVTAVCSALVLASHGFLDGLTDGGLGVAYFWPWSDTRHFLPWRPIPVAPIGLGLLTPRGLMVLAVEAFASLPFFVYAFWPLARPQNL